MTAIEMRDITAEELGKKVADFLRDYWTEVVRVGGEDDQGITICTLRLQISTVHPNTPHRVAFRMGLGSVSETRIVDQSELIDLDDHPASDYSDADDQGPSGEEEIP